MSQPDIYKEHPTSVDRLWRKVMSTFWEDHQRNWYEEVMQRTIVYGNLLRKYGVEPRGILYVGANVGQLLWVWVLLGYRQILMIEPQEKAFEKLQWFAKYSSGLLFSYEQFAGCEAGTEIDVVRCAIGARDGDSELFVMTNSNLSSLLEPSEEVFEQVKAVLGADAGAERLELAERVSVPVKTLDTLLAGMDAAKAAQYNTLYMNIQGGELHALEGAEKTLRQLDFVYLENNFVERYRNTPSSAEIDTLLGKFGFVARWGQKYSDVGTGFTAYVRDRSRERP